MILSSEKSPLIHLPNKFNNQEKNESDDLREKSNQRINLVSTSTTTTTNDCRSSRIANLTVFVLAFTVFVQSYLLEGVFPYAGFLTLHLMSSKTSSDGDGDGGNGGVSINEETVGRYAGYVGCSFMAGRTITAVLWGRLADAYGRIFVLEASLVASAITSLGFGFSSTYEEALVWRFLMGMGNGITGTIKCLLSEIKESSESEAKETKTMAVVYGMRGYGFLLCPAITGYLSDPMRQYPQTMASSIIPKWIQSLLVTYPFVMPNLLAFVLCWGACKLVRDHVEETLPEENRKPISFLPAPAIDWCHRIFRLETTTNDRNETPLKSPTKLCGLSNDDNDKLEFNKTEKLNQETFVATPSSTKTRNLLWSCVTNKNNDIEARHEQRKQIRGRWFHLYTYWMFSFLNIASDELFPLFCLSKLSGLGLLENQISFLLGGTTIFYGILQYWLLTGLVEKFGLYPALRIGTFGSIPLAVLLPLGSLLLLNTSTDNNENNIFWNGVTSEDYEDYEDDNGSRNSKKLNPVVAVYLCVLIATIKSFSSLVFSTITMATNRTVDTIDQRATLNGIATLGGSFAKACGPVFAGTLFSFLVGSASKDTLAAMAEAEPSAVNPVLGDYGIEPPYGSIVAYGVLSILGLLLSLQTFALRDNNPPSW